MNEKLRGSLREALRERVLQLEDELGIDQRLQDRALLARLMGRCLADEEFGNVELERRLAKIIYGRHAQPVEGNARIELAEISEILNLSPGLVDVMWRSYLADFHLSGRGLVGSGQKARLTPEIKNMETAVIEAALTIPIVVSICLRDLPEAHPASAYRAAIEHIESLKDQLSKLDAEIRSHLDMPAVGRNRRRSTDSDERDLNAYFLVYVKKIRVADTRVWKPFSKDSERNQLQDPSVAGTVKARASKMIQKMAKRIDALDPSKSDQAAKERVAARQRKLRIQKVCRLRAMGRANRQALSPGPNQDWQLMNQQTELVKPSNMDESYDF